MTWQTDKTSDSYTPCVLLFPNGTQRKGSVLHVRMDSVDSARRKLADNRAAWVAPGDVERVRNGETVS